MYFKCLNKNKLELAKKIKSKYNLSQHTDDYIIAAGLALAAGCKTKKKVKQ